MSLPLKFGATGLLFLLPLVLLLLDFQGEINRGIRVAELEREGVAYGRPLTALILDVSQGGRSIEGDLRAVDRADGEHGDALGVRADWRRVRAEGQGLEAVGPGRRGAARDLFCGHLIALLTTVGNNSNLILDPDMDSYYTMDTVLTQMPQLMTNVSQARAVADGAGVPGVRQARLAMLVGQIQTPVAAAGDDLRMATGYDQALAPRVAPPFQDLKARAASFTGLLDRFGTAPRFHSEIDHAGDMVFESGRRYDRAGFSVLDQVLARRLHTFLARRTRVDIVAAVSTCLAVAFFCGLYRTTMRTIRQIAEAQTDLTEHRRLEQQLAHQAFHDALTGLPNRALFLDRLEHALARAERGRSSVAVLFVDLDNFKVVNDSLGHAAGDALLCAAAQRLSGCIRPGDTLARLGGDEFTILLENVGRMEAATEVGARIAEALCRPFVVQEHTLFVSASVGVAWDGRADGDARPARPGDLLREADIAMYQAKNGGKARCAVFNQRMNAEAMERLELEGDLRHAIAQDTTAPGELVLHYQPIVSLETGALQEVEALVRWQHPRRGLIPPLRFIPIAEETGLIVPLGLWVLREACRQARQWQREHPRQPPLVVGVNLSARQMEQPDLVAQVSAVLAETGLPAACLKLEITETVMMGNAEGMVLRMRRLKALGVHLAVDDFGTGYSSMAYLSAFPLDTLKIDRSFVTKMAEPEGQAIIQAIITLAHSLHLQVTSEGIETSDQWHRLQALGCEQGQGYFFARPQTSEALAATLCEDVSRLPPVPQPA